MYRKYYLVEVVILLLLSHGGWNGPSVTLLSCTSESSKLIRDVVEKDEDTVCLDVYCDVFRCNILRQKRELAKKREQNLAELTNVKELKASLDEEEDDAKITRQRKNLCEPKAMEALRERCRNVIRQCTIGLLANLSSKDFLDLEEDLDLAVCSYLTCEKYWDDFRAQLHFIPTLVCIVIILLIFTGFCLCYYGTWLIIESPAINTEHICCKCRRRPESKLRRAIHHHVPIGSIQEYERESRTISKRCNGFDSYPSHQMKFKKNKVINNFQHFPS